VSEPGKITASHLSQTAVIYMSTSQVANPVDSRTPNHVRELGHNALGDLPQLSVGRWVCRVGEPDHALLGVGVPYGADEQHLTARRRVRDRLPHLVHGQCGVPDGDQPDRTHPYEVPHLHTDNPGRPRR
jgi:hypothetical protein